MHARRLALGLAALAALAASAPRDARACGACFHVPTENTQVAGHRMVLSVSAQQTTLYDQVRYTGDPSSFAWVLPIHGQVSVGLSSELLFQALDAQTTKVVSAPDFTCSPPPPECGDFAGGGPSNGGDAAADGGSVTIISQATVGPYETVQLSSSDPGALASWLTGHGFEIPPDMAPVIDAYVSEGFDFLAMKLVPGAGITDMRPVRVTTPGAAPTLPLRMVAGGVGAKVAITLFVVAEGSWEPANFPAFRVDPAKIAWDFATESSNYAALVQAGFAAGQGNGWLDEVAIDFSPYAFGAQIQQSVQYGNHDYDEPGATLADALAAAQADTDTLFAGMSPTSVRVSRLRADLPREALGEDLAVQPSSDQAPIPVYVQAASATGSPPCPDYSYCAGDGGAADASAPDASGGPGGGHATDGAADAGAAPAEEAPSDSGSSSCSLGRGSGAAAPAALAVIALLATRRRRRR